MIAKIDPAVDISICVCTFRRYQELTRCLRSIAAAKLPDAIVVELIVVDNDVEGGALAAFELVQSEIPFPSKYVVELVSGVSNARNRCVAEASGSWIAFVDDDEMPSGEWLTSLWDCVQHYAAEGVFGPVVPEFEVEPTIEAAWARLHHRPRYTTGTLMPWGDCRSGNVLYQKSLHIRCGAFDPTLAATGSEDCDFFWRCLKGGAKLVWCDESVVHEVVPATRLTLRWLLRRAFTGGRNFVRLRSRHMGVRVAVADMVWGLAAVLVYGPAALVAHLVSSRHSWALAGKVAGALGKMLWLFHGGKGEYGAGGSVSSRTGTINQ